MKKFSLSRRGILRGSVLGASAVFLAGVVPLSRAAAADLPEVSVDDPTAKSLKYVPDATQSARTDSSQFCHNCRYFKGSEGTATGPCDIFSGKAVRSNGWCSAWSKRA